MRRSSTAWIALLAALAAVVGTRPYAGSWNDASRLAMVESLVDHGTLAIDDSIFLRPTAPGRPSPYLPDDPFLKFGTFDKLFIEGHWYSDKPPVPGLLLALWYQILQWATGLTARVHPASFCWQMNLIGAGVPYVLAVLGIYRLGRETGLSETRCLVLTGVFALGTLALPYSRHANNHILMLAFAAWQMVLLLRFSRLSAASMRPSPVLAAGIGCLAGAAYTCDLGAGPPLMLVTLALVLWCSRSMISVTICLLGALPWLGLHHGVNWWVGGTIVPANAVPDYLRWPGSPFTGEAMTGRWHHPNAWSFMVYALALLGGKHGFLTHDLPLLLLFPAAAAWLTGGFRRHRALVFFAFAWCGGTWLLYALASRNYSGACCSIRWFVPLLAPGFLVLALHLKETPAHWPAFRILGAWGCGLMAVAWWAGPWSMRMVPGYWCFVAGALLHLAWHRWMRPGVRQQVCSGSGPILERHGEQRPSPNLPGPAAEQVLQRG